LQDIGRQSFFQKLYDLQRIVNIASNVV